MKRITITIETGNAAFEDNGNFTETATILRKLAAKFDNGVVPGKLLDTNGNACGKVKITNTSKSMF